MPAIGPATRVFEFRRDARKHFAIGMPGLIGALSGMVPGGFSITINWAPPASFPFFYSVLLYEIRETLEKKMPDKILQVVTKGDKEVWQRGLLGGIKRIR